MKLKYLVLDKDLKVQRTIHRFFAMFTFFENAGLHLNNLTTDEIKHEINVADVIFVDPEIITVNNINLNEMAMDKIIIYLLPEENNSFKREPAHAIFTMIKPLSFGLFSKVVNSIVETFISSNKKIRKTKNKTLLIRSGHQKIPVNINDIEFIESMQNYLKIHTAEACILTLMTLKSIMKILPGKMFVQIHRCYIVSINKIKAIGKNKIYLNSENLPLSRTYKLNLTNLYLT